jgi:hypothetical protein
MVIAKESALSDGGMLMTLMGVGAHVLKTRVKQAHLTATAISIPRKGAARSTTDYNILTRGPLRAWRRDPQENLRSWLNG